MTIRLVFPDPLEWQSGLEWGVEAAAILVREGHDVECVFRATGPMFEAVAFAALDLGILDRCTFDDTAVGKPSTDDIVVLPRVNVELRDIAQPPPLWPEVRATAEGVRKVVSTEQTSWSRSPSLLAAAIQAVAKS